MKNFSKRLLQLTAALVVLAVMVTACKRTFDEPPYNSGDPDLTVTHTIKQFQALYTGSATVISDDVIIAGVVTGDDASGNIYKYIVIQDSTAGMNIQLDASSLNATYPIGRKVYIKAKGLTLGTYGGMLELGLGLSSGYPARIPQSEMANYLVAGSTQNVVEPVELTVDQLTSSYQSMLVKLKGVEVSKYDTSKTYGDPTLVASYGYVGLLDCSADSIVIRTSSYANFTGVKAPKGHGDVTGIYTFYNSTNQFVIRDTSDLTGLTGTRCDGSTVTTPTTGAKVDSIAALRALYLGRDTTATGTITGVVVSNSSNEATGNYRIAQENNLSGIMVYTGSAVSTLVQGAKVQITVGSTDKLTAYNGELEFQPKATSSISVVSTGATVTPRVVTVKDVINNRAKWSSTLVTLQNVTVSAGVVSGTTGYNYTISDATGSLVSFVRNAANITVTPGTATSFTGYVSLYSTTAGDTTTQLNIRTASDIVMQTTTPVTKANFTGLYSFGSVVSGSGGKTDPTAVPTASNMTFGSFAYTGSSLNPNASGRFSFVGWPKETTPQDTSYYSVTITPDAGYKLNFDSVSMVMQRSGTGIAKWVVRSSVDNYASNLPASITYTNGDLSITATNIFTVADVSVAETGSAVIFGSDHTGLTGAVTFRFYGFAAEASTGTFSLNKVSFAGSIEKQ